MSASMERRDFLKGLGLTAVGAGTAAFMAGCSPQPQPLGDTGASEGEGGNGSAALVESSTCRENSDWLGEAPSLSEADCADAIDCDILIVGAGLAGSMSAYGALRNGASRVVLLERNSVCHVGGCEASFINAQYQRDNGIPEYNKIEMTNELFIQTQMRSDIALWSLWANRSGEILDDMVENFLDPYGQYHMVNSMENFYPDPTVEMSAYNSAGVKFNDAGDDLTGFLDNLHRFIEDNGGEIHYSVRAEKLVQDDTGRVTGVIATKDGAPVAYRAAKGVIMCTGSFGANEAMMREFYPRYFADYALANNAYSAYMNTVDEVMDDGLGHRMLCWAGAVMEDEYSYMSWQNRGWMSMPYLQVNNNGDRFMNECTPGLMCSHIVAAQPGFTSYVWQILPTNDFQMPSVFGLTKELLEMLGALEGEHFEADTIPELAELMGVDADRLQATVDRYNELCAKGEDDDYQKAPRYLDAIDDPPYQAWRAQYNFYCTMAGVRCNNKMQVLDARQVEIPGLYAAGNTVGYRFGSCYQNTLHGATNSLAIVHGYVAGESAAKS